jgi:hypothetical protein
VFEDPEVWTPQEHADVVSLAAALPESLRRPGRPIVLVRAGGPPPSTDELVRLQRRPGHVALTVFDGGHMRAGLVHALTHVADRAQRWSTEPAWLHLSQWRRLAGVWWTPERDHWAFARPRGMDSPAEDLATLAEAAFTEAPPSQTSGSTDHHPACRMPSKWRVLGETIGLPETLPQTGPECADLAGMNFDPATIERVEVIYVAATGASAASVSGHVLVGLRFRPDAEGIVRHDSFGLVADTSGVVEGSAAYAWRGLTGGFSSRVSREPFSATILRYSQFENRELRRFQLRLTDTEKAQLLARLDELQQAWDRPYLFSHRNCTELVIELVGSFRDFSPPHPVSPDVVMALLDREGLLEPVAADRPEEMALGARAVRARAQRAREVAALVRLLDEGALSEGAAGGLRAAEEGMEDLDASVRADAYVALADIAAQEASLVEGARRVLAWSDIIEQSAMLKVEGAVTAQHTTAVDGIRRASATLRAAAGAAVSSAALAVQQAELQANQAAHSTHRTAHTGYRPLRMEPAVRLDPAGAVPWMTLSTPLYEGRQGDGRRFGISPGMGLAVLGGELQVPLDRVGWLRGRFRLVEAQHVDLSRAWPKPGWTLGALSLQHARERTMQTESTWLYGGGLLTLVQHDELRHHLMLTAGLAAMSWTRSVQPAGLEGLWTKGERITQGNGLALPLGFRAQLQAAGQPLTRLNVGGAWTPRVDLRGDWLLRPEARVQGQVRLGEFGGWDGALTASAAGRAVQTRTPQAGSAQTSVTLEQPELELRMGLVFERW